MTSSLLTIISLFDTSNHNSSFCLAEIPLYVTAFFNFTLANDSRLITALVDVSMMIIGLFGLWGGCASWEEREGCKETYYGEESQSRTDQRGDEDGVDSGPRSKASCASDMLTYRRYHGRGGCVALHDRNSEGRRCRLPMSDKVPSWYWFDLGTTCMWYWIWIWIAIINLPLKKM